MSRLVGLALLLTAQVAEASVTLPWVDVGDPGNACEVQGTNCHGAVAYDYRIGRVEVTNEQYTEMLNAVAAADPNALYSTNMAGGFGGITRSGVSGSYSYTAKVGFENRPVVWVSYLDAMRFANWLHNGQPNGAQDASTTEDGAYSITAQGIADNSITRNPGASVFVPSEDEWYKAAYYDAGSSSYFDYPAGSDTPTTCAVPGTTPNTANCSQVVGIYVDVESYPNAPGPYGSFDQGGNVWEFNEAVIAVDDRGLRGGEYANGSSLLAAANRSRIDPAFEASNVGMRLAAPPASQVPAIGPFGHGLLALLLAAAAASGLRASPCDAP